MSGLKEELLKQAEEINFSEAKDSMRHIPNLETNKLPTSQELAAAEHAAIFHAKVYAATHPEASMKDVAREKLSYQKDLLEQEDLIQLVSQMEADRANPKAYEDRLKAAIEVEKKLQARMDSVFGKAPIKTERDSILDGIVNEISGKKPSEYERQAAEHFANQYVIAQKAINPALSDKDAKDMLFSRTKDLLESGDLKELAQNMTDELKNPDKIKAGQDREIRTEKAVLDVAAVFKGRED